MAQLENEMQWTAPLIHRSARACELGQNQTMAETFNRGNHVEWNSKADRGRGVILKKAVSDVRLKDYTHRASRADPQYLITSDKTDHVAIHKGPALRLIKPQAQQRDEGLRE